VVFENGVKSVSVSCERTKPIFSKAAISGALLWSFDSRSSHVYRPLRDDAKAKLTVLDQVSIRRIGQILLVYVVLASQPEE